MLKRPRNEEDEEDLLQLQSEFLSKKQQPSAQVTKGGKNEELAPEIADNHDVPTDIEVNIVERDTSKCIVRPPSRPQNPQSGFPKAFKLKLNATSTGTGSLFARSVGLKRQDVGPSSTMVQFEKSKLLDGSGLGPGNRSELDTIHLENCQMLSGLSPQEIEEARKQILEKLKPESVAFLKSGTKRKGSQNLALKSDQKPSTSSAPSQMEVDTEMKHLPISPGEVSKHKWLNMDKVEADKLEWLKPIPEDKSKDFPPQDILAQLGIKDARFNLDGNIITEKEQLSLTGREGLHHHGDEPERGGYTLTELITLLESSYASQKVIALNLLGRIMERSHRGVFDPLLEMSSLAQQLLECTPVLLMVRKSLDDTSSSVSTAALACLKQILCNLELDELYLDRIFPWFFISPEPSFAPFLDPQFRGKKDEPIEEMADAEYVKKDPIPALIRTDLLVRLAYLLEHQVKEQDDPVAIKNLFAILIRVARHSFKSSQAIVRTPYLLGHIVKYFVQTSFVSMELNTFYGNPYSKAVKLLRILCQEKSLACEIYHLFGDQLASSCSSYLALDPLSIEEPPESNKRPSDFLQLVQEGLRMLCVLTSQELALDAIRVMTPIFVRQGQYFLTLDSVALNSREKQFDWQYASSLFVLLRNLCRNMSEMRPIYHELIASVTFQWICQMNGSSSLPVSVDASNAIMCGVLFLLGHPTSAELKFFSEMATSFKKNDCKLVDKVFDLLSGNSCIIHAEKILTETRSCTVHPEYHSLLESSGKIHGVLADESAIPLVYTIICTIKYLNSTKTDDNCREFIRNSSLVTFIRKISQSTFATDSFFTRYEVDAVKEIVYLASTILTGDLDDLAPIYLLAAIRLVPMLKTGDEKKQLLQKVILNGKLHPNQLPRMLESSVNIGPRSGKSTLDELLENVLLIYSNMSPLCTEYWVFDPILYVTKLVKSVSSNETDFTQVLEVTLSFLQLLLDSAPGYFNFTRIPENCNRFTATSLILIMGVYLTGNKYFLDSKIKLHLKTILEVYLVDESPSDRKFLLNCDSIIPGQLLYGKECKMSSPKIGQFFQRILQEYSAESYSDPLFTSFILLFLRSSSESLGSQSMRLLFFSQDNSELLQSMYTRLEDYDKDLLMQLLDPCEKDANLIELFIKCLLSGAVVGVRNPVCYWMLVYHVHHFLFKENNPAIEQRRKEALVASIKAVKDDTLRGHLTDFKMEPVVHSFLVKK